MNSTRY